VIIAAAMSRRLEVIGVLFGAALVLALVSRIPLATLAKRVWIPVLLFTGVIAAPAPFVVPGRVVGRLPELGWPVTAQGLLSASYLVSPRRDGRYVFRAPYPLDTLSHVLKALRVLRVPVVLWCCWGWHIATCSYCWRTLATCSNRAAAAWWRIEWADRRRMPPPAWAC